MTIKLLILLTGLFLIQPDITMPDAEEVILNKAEEVIYQQTQNEYIRFELSARWIPGSLRSLNGNNIETVKPVGALQKYTSFEVSFIEFGERKSAEVQLQIEAEQKVPVLIERKARGESINETDVEMRWVNVDMNRDNPVQDLQSLKGKTLRRSLTAGQFIDQNDIGASFLIEAGDSVEMIYQQHGLQVLLSCESRQEGAGGDEIQIYCKETRKKYLAVITGSGEVQWLKTH